MKLKDIRAVAEANGGIIDNKTAEKNGISRAVLSLYCQKGTIIRIDRGQYIFADSERDELLSVSKRSPGVVFSHETALFLNGLTAALHNMPSITARSGKSPSSLVLDKCKTYYIKTEYFELGKTLRQTKFGNEVPCYDAERTICDIIRSRHRIGKETVSAAAAAYIASPGKNTALLKEYADKMVFAKSQRRLIDKIIAGQKI